MYKYFLINLFLINVCFNLEYLSPNYFNNQKNNSSSDIDIQTEEFNYLIGIMVDFSIERESFEDINNNGYWDENEPFEDINNNGTIDFHDYNNDDLVRSLGDWFEGEVDVVTFYMDQPIDEEISMSWHLTPKDKIRIYNSLSSDDNLRSIQKIQSIFNEH